MEKQTMEICVESEQALGALNDISKAVRDMQRSFETAGNALKETNRALSKLSEKEAELEEETSSFGINMGQTFNVLQGVVAFSINRIGDGLIKMGKKSTEAGATVGNATANTSKSIVKMAGNLTGHLLNAIQAVGLAFGLTIGKFALVAGAVAIAATGIKLLGDAFDSNKKAAENLRESQEKYAESFGPMAEGAAKFREELANAESSMKNFNNSILITEEHSQKLANALAEAQKGLTSIVQSESAQRGELTKKEAEEMQGYYDTIKTLSDEEMSLHTKRMEQNEGLTQAFVNNYKGSADGFLEESTRFIKGAQDEAAAVKEAAEKKRDGIISNAMEMVGTSSEYTQEWFEAEAAKAYADCEQATEIAQMRSTNVTKIVADEFLQRSDSLQNFVNLTIDTNGKMQEEDKKHADELEQIEENRRINRENGLMTEAEVEEVYRSQKREENERHTNEMAEYYKLLGGQMDEATIQQAGAYLQMIADVQNEGGVLSDEQQEMATNLVRTLSGLPDEYKKKGLDALSELNLGLSDEDGTVAKSSEEIVAKANSGLVKGNNSNDQNGTKSTKEGKAYASGYVHGIHSGLIAAYNSGYDMSSSAVYGTKAGQRSASPSKVTRELGHDYTEGYMLGIEDQADEAVRAAEALAKKTVDAMQGEIASDQNVVAALVAKMTAAVSLETSAFSARIGAAANYQAGGQLAGVTNNVGGDTYILNQPVATPGELFRAARIRRKEAAYE